MTDEEREGLIRKIRALLAKADPKRNPSAAEAYAAAVKAQELLARAGLTEADVAEREDAEVIIAKLDLGAMGAPGWAGSIAWVVAKNFRCDEYTDWADQRIKLVGLEADLRIAVEVTYYAIGSALECWADYVFEHPGASRKDYLIGFANGLHDAFKAAAAQHADDARWGLVLRTPAVVREAVERLNLSTGRPARIHDRDAFLRGRADGRERGTAPRNSVRSHR